MLISDIFKSIQGESTYVGLPCVFVRLSGCNLRCKWCDTTEAQVMEEGRELTIEEILKEIAEFKTWLVELTGGEPLLQPDTRELARRLIQEDYRVLIETNGSVSIEGLDENVIKIVDIKCPASGHVDSFKMDNLDHITVDDEVKFVISNREDFDFARDFIDRHISEKTTKLLFAPVRPALAPSILADWILKEGLNVRLQVQIHAHIWKKGPEGIS